MKQSPDELASAYPYSATVANRISTLRRERGWSAQHLADQLAANGHPIARSTVAKIEKGLREQVTVDELYAFARTFGVPADRLAHDHHVCPTCGDAPPEGFICTACSRRSCAPGTPAVQIK